MRRFCLWLINDLIISVNVFFDSNNEPVDNVALPETILSPMLSNGLATTNRSCRSRLREVSDASNIRKTDKEFWRNYEFNECRCTEITGKIFVDLMFF